MYYYNSLQQLLIHKFSVLVQKNLKTVCFSTKVSEPLRILYCGSDKFSVASLRALESEKRINPCLIKSIDVVCRPSKPVGRGLKKIVEAPIKTVANDIGSKVHEIDSFTGWELPSPDGELINLIIAVSFGLFVPSRILKSTKYGGLNLHPSILPKRLRSSDSFRGPAPLQRTLMTGYRFSGVTLQTLDHKNFDQGIVLDQTNPWLEIPALCSYDQLLDMVTPLAARMLVNGLNQRLFVPPLKHVGWIPREDQELFYASKITSADRQVLWSSESGIKTIVQTYFALGRLWSYVYISPESQKRLQFDDIHPEMQKIYCIDDSQDADTKMKELAAKIGKPIHFIVVPTSMKEKRYAVFYYENKFHKGSVNFIFPEVDPKGSWSSLRIGKITVEGKPMMTAQQALKSLRNEKSQWCLKSSWNFENDNVNHFTAYPYPNL